MGDDPPRCIKCGRFVHQLWDGRWHDYYGEVGDNTLCEEHGGPSQYSPTGAILYGERWWYWFAGKNIAIGPHAPVETPLEARHG